MPIYLAIYCHFADISVSYVDESLISDISHEEIVGPTTSTPKSPQQSTFAANVVHLWHPKVGFGSTKSDIVESLAKHAKSVDKGSLIARDSKIILINMGALIATRAWLARRFSLLKQAWNGTWTIHVFKWMTTNSIVQNVKIRLPKKGILMNILAASTTLPIIVICAAAVVNHLNTGPVWAITMRRPPVWKRNKHYKIMFAAFARQRSIKLCCIFFIQKYFLIPDSIDKLKKS